MNEKIFNKEIIQATIVAAINEGGGSITHRILWNKLWGTAYFIGNGLTEEWLREVARPDFEPPLPETKWRLR